MNKTEDKKRKLKLSDINLSNTNQALVQGVADQSINYCQIIAMPMERKLSVTAAYDNSQKFVTLNKMIEPVSCDSSNAFFGASPLLDNKVILEAISTLQLSTAEGLDDFIKDHHDKFFITKRFEKYLPHLARYITIAFASNFGVTILLSDAEKKPFTKLASQYPDIVTLEVDKSKGKTINKLTISGCPNEQVLFALSKYRFTKLPSITDEDTTIQFIIDDNGADIHSIYNDVENISIIKGAVFYSGVLLKTTRLEIQKNVYENYRTDSLTMHYIESSFATVYALDHNLTEHPLLSKSKDKIIKLLKKDDRAKKNMMDCLNDLANSSSQTSQSIIECINEYLTQTVNVNQIGVSSNITTSDNILLLGRRSGSKNSYDGYALYPSVNGNAEIASEKVAFYQYSVHEDMPTMTRKSPRNDFVGEIVRESNAELALSFDNNAFSCIGVTICGNIPNDKDIDESKSERYTASFRRCHFNILFETNTQENFENVLKISKGANESFENEKFSGRRLHCYENIGEFFGSHIKGLIMLIKGQKDLVESIVTAFVSILSFLLYGQTKDYTVISFVSLFFAYITAAASIINFVYAIKSWFIKAINNKITVIYPGASIKKIHNKVKRSFKGNLLERTVIGIRKLLFPKKYRPITYHPVTYALVTLYIQRKVYNTFSSTPKKKQKRT